MTTLRPKDGFDWSHVAWGRPDSPRSALCSYCAAGIGEDDAPLILFRSDGAAAQFCDRCMETWWGMRTCRDNFDDLERTP